METLTSWEERGMEKGRAVERQTIALNMLQKQVALETIAEFTGLTIAQLQELQSQAEPTQE